MNLLLLHLLAIVVSPIEDVQPDHVNVALSMWGSTATASSVYRQGYGPMNAIDGRWKNIDGDKWNTARNKTPHWLVIDFGQARRIDRIVVRHQGADGHEVGYNTSDFRLQRGDAASGPWVDLVSPIRNNKANVTTHDFAVVATRFIRLLVEKGEPNGNEYARIYEVEAYAPIGALATPLLGLSAAFPPEYRRGPTGVEQLVEAQLHATRAAAWELEIGGQRIGLTPGGPAQRVWVPAATASSVQSMLRMGGQFALQRKFAPTPPPSWGWFAGGQIAVIGSSHQDIAWMDSPEACRRQRDVEVITPALGLLGDHPDYAFDLESSMNIMEYLETHPERKDEVAGLMAGGRLGVGATYNQPYEGLLSGEQLVREFYFGRRWIKRNLPGADSRVAWNPDVPGRAAQMPQIMAKAGVPYLLISRMTEGLFRWEAPDGSSVLTFSPGQYGNAVGPLMSTVPNALQRIAADLRARDGAYRQANAPNVFPMLFSSDSIGPHYFGDLAGAWNAQKPDALTDQGPPTFGHATARSFFDRIADGEPQLEVKRGERPNVWLYIHGPTHHLAIDAKRAAARLLPAAEATSTFRCLLEGSFRTYPQKVLTQAWADSIFDDHGWGGNQGQITDQLFRSKLEHARRVGQSVLDQNLRWFAARVKRPKLGVPIVVFNTLSWARSEPVECDVPIQKGGVSVLDASGRTVPVQVLQPKPGQPRGVQRLAFLAKAVPAFGYTSYSVVPKPSGMAPGARTIANSWYIVKLAPGGVQSIYDRQLKRELLNSGKFLGGEVFTMRSVGNGAGEFTEVQQPDMEAFDKGSLHKPVWRLTEDGPMLTAYVCEWARPDCTVRQTLAIHNSVKRIDFKVHILNWNGNRYREFRMALPLRAEPEDVAYETPFAHTRVGRDEIAGAAGYAYGGVDYSQPCKDVRPREVRDTISALVTGGRVTLSTSVSVFDFADPTPRPAKYPIIQPILLASRKSCHGNGNWYLQEGDHDYSFSLGSSGGAGGWYRNVRFASGANDPLVAVAGVRSRPGAALPATLSFASLSVPNVLVSTIKKAEDDDSVVVRCYETDGEPVDAVLRLFRPFRSALRTDIIEEGGTPVPLRDGGLRVKLGKHAIETYRLRPGPSVAAASSPRR